jgi:hypothetical protein
LIVATSTMVAVSDPTPDKPGLELATAVGYVVRLEASLGMTGRANSSRPSKTGRASCFNTPPKRLRPSPDSRDRPGSPASCGIAGTLTEMTLGTPELTFGIFGPSAVS